MLNKVLFEKGKLAFNRAEYFEAHGIWEEIWQDLRINEPESLEITLLQALIQLAVALHLIQEDRLIGAKKVLERARINIDNSNELIWSKVNTPKLASEDERHDKQCVINGVNIELLYQEIIRFLGKSDFDNCRTGLNSKANIFEGYLKI